MLKTKKIIAQIIYQLPKVVFINQRSHKVINPIPWKFEIDYLKLKEWLNY